LHFSADNGKIRVETGNEKEEPPLSRNAFSQIDEQTLV
jgi:hypothetical protein